MATKYTVKCRRCNGTGIWTGWTPAGRGGECFGCDGTGSLVITRYTVEEKAAIQDRLRRRNDAYTAIDSRARELGKQVGDSELRWDATYGFAALEEQEPERYAKMLDSLDAGRLDEVINALAAYYRAPRAN